MFPNGQFVSSWFGGDKNGYIGILTIGIGWLIIGGILAPAFYKKSLRDINSRWALETASTFQISEKVVSKTFQVVGDRFSTGTIYHVYFDFSDGSRKSFSVNAAQYSVIVENESGLLTYKQQGDYVFFVVFQRKA